MACGLECGVPEKWNGWFEGVYVHLPQSDLMRRQNFVMFDLCVADVT